MIKGEWGRSVCVRWGDIWKWGWGEGGRWGCSVVCDWIPLFPSSVWAEMCVWPSVLGADREVSVWKDAVSPFCLLSSTAVRLYKNSFNVSTQPLQPAATATITWRPRYSNTFHLVIGNLKTVPGWPLFTFCSENLMYKVQKRDTYSTAPVFS